MHRSLLAHWWVQGHSSLFLCVLECWRSAGALRKLLGFGWPIRVQEEGEVTFTLDGEGLVGGEDMVPFPSRADLLEGCCTICWAALAPGAPGFTHTAAAELACEACGQWVLALMLSAHEAETQALLLWFVGNALCARGTQAMTRRADTAVRARIVETVTMATHAGHHTFVDVLAVGAVEPLVALGAVSTHLPTYRSWLLHPCILKLWALVTLALSPGSTDATAAIFLLGEAGQRVAATRLLGQCVLEAAAQWFLGGWPRVRGLGMRQQVLGGGWTFSIRPLDAVHLNGSFRRVMDTHVHHRGRSLHFCRDLSWPQGHQEGCMLCRRTLPRPGRICDHLHRINGVFASHRLSFWGKGWQRACGHGSSPGQSGA